MVDFFRGIFVIIPLLLAFQAQAQWGHTILQAGYFVTSSAEPQHIDINYLLGDDYTVDDGTGSAALLGIGYFFTALDHPTYRIDYGVDAFYLFNTAISGDVSREGMFQTLSYRYELTNVPVYAVVKTIIPLNETSRHSFAIDVGIGPNFMMTNDYTEKSLDNGISQPNDQFGNKTNILFSATLGLGYRLERFWGPAGLEVGYRFFYLGNGEFENKTDEILDTFQTGTTYANAFVIALNF